MMKKQLNTLINDLIGNIDIFKHKLHILNYILILGGGNYGIKALNHSLKIKKKYILIIDKKIPKNLGVEFNIIKNWHDLHDLIMKIEFFSKNKNQTNIASEKRVYFYKSDIEKIFTIFNYGIPEYIIPVVPIHFSGKYVQFLMKNLTEYIENIFSISNNINDAIFGELTKSFPNNIVLSKSSKNGIILLSWAKENEICPDNCIGPPNYCSTFKRNKDNTIIEYIEKNSNSNGIEEICPVNYILFKSEQLTGGLGAILGKEFKKNIVNLLFAMIEMIKNNNCTEKLGIIGISTACNCHGVINYFEIKFRE